MQSVKTLRKINNKNKMALGLQFLQARLQELEQQLKDFYNGDSRGVTEKDIKGDIVVIKNWIKNYKQNEQ